MKNLILIALLIFASGTFVVAQDEDPRIVPTPTPRLTPEIDRAQDQGKNISARSDNLRRTEIFPVEDSGKRKALKEALDPLYRESTKEERAAIAPSAETVNANAGFLAGKNTGIIRLAADIGCSSKNGVVSGIPQCTQYSMPGAGSSYSFREGDYRIFRLSDINYNKNKFESLGVMTHGIMVDLGDVPIEQVDLNTGGVKHVAKVSPASNFGEAGEFAGKLQKGYQKDGFTYSSVLPAKLNSTYVLRSIAYRGEAPQSAVGIAYNELDFDKRRDVIIVFRVVSIQEGKEVTLIWKSLRNKKSQKL